MHGMWVLLTVKIQLEVGALEKPALDCTNGDEDLKHKKSVCKGRSRKKNNKDPCHRLISRNIVTDEGICLDRKARHGCLWEANPTHCNCFVFVSESPCS